MKVIPALFLIVCIISGCEKKNAPINDTKEPVQPIEKKIEILADYTGVCNMGINHPEDRTVVKKNLTIRSQADFDAFIAKIPKSEISKIQPAPENDDPLLKNPGIDFDKNMAVVMTRSNTLSAVPTVTSILLKGDALTVNGEYPAPSPCDCFPYGISVYRFVVIEKHTGDVVYNMTDKDVSR